MPAPDVSRKITLGTLRLETRFPFASGLLTALDESIRLVFRLGREGAAIKTILPESKEFSCIPPRFTESKMEDVGDGCSLCSHVCPEGVIVMQARPHRNGH